MICTCSEQDALSLAAKAKYMQSGMRLIIVEERFFRSADVVFAMML